MEIESFYTKLTAYLSKQGFYEIEAKDVTFELCRGGDGVDIEINFEPLQINIDQLRTDLKSLSEVKEDFLIRYKYDFGRLTIMGFINSDNCTDNDLIEVSNVFFDILDNKMTNYTQVINGRSTVIGSIGFIFQESEKSNSFIANTMSKCCHNNRDYDVSTSLSSKVFDLEKHTITDSDSQSVEDMQFELFIRGVSTKGEALYYSNLSRRYLNAIQHQRTLAMNCCETSSSLEKEKKFEEAIFYQEYSREHISNIEEICQRAKEVSIKAEQKLELLRNNL